jgi:hypothetical protein
MEKEPWPALDRAEVESIRNQTPPKSLFLSDAPDYLATAIERNTLLLPTLKTVDRSLERWNRPIILHRSPENAVFLKSESESTKDWEIWLEKKKAAYGAKVMNTGTGHSFVRVQ